MASTQGDKKITVYVNEKEHLELRRKILPQSFSDWLRNKVAEELKGAK